MRYLLALAVVAAGLSAHGAELPVLVPPPAVADEAMLRLRTALERFDFGDYAAVVTELEALVEHGALALPAADRLEALRAYGISCVLVDRRTAAEGAFMLLLEADPQAQLDRQLVRPESVAVFESVRGRRNATLLTAYRRGKTKRYTILNFLPPAGQFQNRQYGKAYSVLGFEIALLATNLTTGSLLYAWRGSNQDFPGHEDTARLLRPLNWVSFGALITVVAYGIIDGLVVGHRKAREERAIEQRLRGEPARSAVDPTSTGVAFQF